jgi:hypothetical protein
VSAHSRLTLVHDPGAALKEREHCEDDGTCGHSVCKACDPKLVKLAVGDEGSGLCDCGQAAPCNLACIFGAEVEARRSQEPLKLLGRAELEPGEYIHNGRVWYCADRLSK